MRSSSRLSLVLSSLVLAGVAVFALGCGGSDDVPADGIAKVGDTVITKASFEQALERGLRGQAQSGAAAPDPPDFEKCIAGLRRQQPKSSKQKDGELEKQCRQSYNDLRRQTIEALIRAAWVEQSAEEHDVEVTDAEARQSLESQKQQIYPDEKDYRKFLRTSGTTEAEILEQIRTQLLEQLVTEKATEGKADVSSEDVADYYRSNREEYGTPDRRDVLVVLAETRGQALEAKRALMEGQSWIQVAKRYSIDRTTKSKGGRLSKVERGSEEQAVDEAIFSARRGALVGPVESQFGWYLLEVTKIRPATQKTLDEARDEIREKLTTERQQKALTEYTESYEKKYKEKTHCARGYVVPICKGAPEPPPTSDMPIQVPTQ